MLFSKITETPTRKLVEYYKRQAGGHSGIAGGHKNEYFFTYILVLIEILKMLNFLYKNFFGAFSSVLWTKFFWDGKKFLRWNLR